MQVTADPGWLQPGSGATPLQPAGIFRSGLNAVELHWHISALSYFNVSNRATFSHIFGAELFNEHGQNSLRQHVGDMILKLVLI